MMLRAPPAWKRVTETTAASVGLTERDTIVCSAWTMPVPTMIGSMERCGLAAWAPLPLMMMVNSSVEASMGPGRMANSPGASPGMLCMP